MNHFIPQTKHTLTVLHKVRDIISVREMLRVQACSMLGAWSYKQILNAWDIIVPL
jgi:hypothetical protein